MKMEAKSLLTYHRWDIIIKYVYIKYFHLYCQHYPNKHHSDYMTAPELKWFRDLYLDHLKVLNGGYEVKTYFQSKEKHTLGEFLNDFHNLYFSIKKNGFDSKYPIPISHEGTILNGAHRIAVSTLFRLTIPVEKVKTTVKLDLPPGAFNNRLKYKMPTSNPNNVIPGLTQEQQDFVLREYVQLKNKKLRFVIIFNNYTHHAHETYLNTYLEKKSYKIIYQKNIQLSSYGTFNFIRHLYFQEPKVNITWKTSQAYFAAYANKFPEQFTSRVILVESSNFANLSPSGARDKVHLRERLGSQHALHVTDNPMETLRMANLIYHRASLGNLNLLPLRQSSIVSKFFLNYKAILETNQVNLSEQFLIVSSFFLGLQGLRTPSDLDFLYDHHLIQNALLHRSSHNKYLQYYPDLFYLLYHPHYHLYYLSQKIISLKELSSMKKARNEPKDQHDLKLINIFQKFSNLRNQLSIITTTHAVPSAPSIKIIETSLRSLYQKCPGSQVVHHWIYFDSREDSVSLEYWKNLQKLAIEFPNIILVKEPHSGLKPNYLKAIRNIVTPYLMFLEHDWIFLEKIDLSKIIVEFKSKPNFHYLKFNKRNNFQKGGWDKVLVKDPSIKNFLAIKTNAWSNHPHLTRRQKWLSSWLMMVSNPKLQKLKGSFGIEEILYNIYQLEINQLGFERAHLKWGCYNYGSDSGKALVQHIDGSERYDKNSIDGRQIKIE